MLVIAAILLFMIRVRVQFAALGWDVESITWVLAYLWVEG